MEHFGEKRTLGCVVFGRVVPVGELFGSPYSKRTEGDGFAVVTARTAFLRRLFPKENALLSPADATVTENERGMRLTLRTGDGVVLTVIAGAEGSLFPQAGERVVFGAPIGRLNGTEPVLVLFCEPSQISELHIHAGYRRAGSTAAAYRPRRAD